MEWFRTVFGVTGFLDFYVNNNLEWGVELLRGGDRMKEHVDHFADREGYEDIPFKRWVIMTRLPCFLVQSMELN